jgi:hypothetical protein
MVAALDHAQHQSLDLHTGPVIVTSVRTSSGRRGRPRVHIQPEILQQYRQLNQPQTRQAQTFNCAARTVRRRALEYGQATPGLPVATRNSAPHGTHHAGAQSMSTMTDEQLDSAL